MLRWTTKLATLSLLVAAGGAMLYLFQFRGGAAAGRLESERRGEQLKVIAKRLQIERRTADVIVINQRPSTRPATAPATAPAAAAAATQPATSPGGGGATFQTTLLFVEYDRDGKPLPARAFIMDGDAASVDAVVIHFDGKFANEHNALRGHSVALLTRLCGDNQPPEKGQPVDPRNDIPPVYRGDDPRVTEFERTLWQNIWRLAEDEAYQKEMGVRVVRPEGAQTRFLPDRLYTLTLETDGGLHVSSRPLQGAYRDALRRHASLD